MPRKNTAGDAPQAIPITMPPMFAWQQRVHVALCDPAIRFVFCVTAQQIGKTTLAVAETVDCALKGGEVWWVAPDYSLTEPGYDMFDNLFSQPPFDQIVTPRKSENRFYIKNGGKTGMIQIKSADEPHRLRGKTLDMVVADEAAFMHPVAWHSNLIHRLTIRRGKALIISNPYGKNWLWDEWRRGDPENPNRDSEYASFQFSQYDNPLIDPADIERRKLTMPSRQFQREVMGEFVDDGGEVFVGVRAAATAPIGAMWQPGHQYYGGLDFGSRQDPTSFIIYDGTASCQVAKFSFLESVWERQYENIEAAYRAWHLEFAEVEENAAGDVAIQALEGRGLKLRRWHSGTTTKRPLIEEWAAAIELNKARILPDDELLRQHESMESDVTANGTVRYYGAKGMHDDDVIASALAYRAATVRDDKPQVSMTLLPHTLYNSGSRSARSDQYGNSRRVERRRYR
jgi:hypothetical protein